MLSATQMQMRAKDACIQIAECRFVVAKIIKVFV